MEKSFDNMDEDREAVERFEKMLQNSENLFFELNSFEYIISHYMETGNFSNALEACSYALEQYPYSSEIMLDKAQLLASSGKTDEAFTLLEKIEAIQPFDSDVITLRGSIMIQAEQYGDAIDYLEDMETYVEDKDILYFQIGVAYQQLGNYELAIQNLKEAVTFNLNNEEALFELANCLDITGQLENSISFYQKFIDKDPYSFIAWYNIGTVYSKLSKFENAVFAFDYATVIKEDFSSSWFNMGNAYMNLDLYEKAENAYRKTMEYETPDAEVFCYLAASLEKQEKYTEAISFYKKSIKHDPLYADAWYGVGFCLNEQKKWFESLHFLKKAIDLDKENGDYWMTIADSEYKLGNTLSSLEAYEQANLLDPENIDVWLNWSFIFFEQGDYEKATNIIRAGIDELPEEAELYYRATIYLIYESNFKDAFLYLENALILKFETHTVLFEFFTDIEIQKALYKIIDQYKN